MTQKITATAPNNSVRPFSYYTQARNWAVAEACGPCSVLVSADATKWLPSRKLIMYYGGHSHLPLAHAGIMAL